MAIALDTLYSGSEDESVRFWEFKDELHYMVNLEYSNRLINYLLNTADRRLFLD